MELQSTMDLLKSNTLALDGDIANSNQNLQEVKENSESMTETVKEVAKGVGEQAMSISHISEMMNDADIKIHETKKVSDNLGLISSRASEIVKLGSQKIEQMDKQPFFQILKQKIKI